MMNYKVIDREAGNHIDTFPTRKEAIEAISKYEEDDKAEGAFQADFYEVKESDGGSINE